MIADVIQVGAHVGKGDRVFAAVKEGHIQSGILLEPIPELFEELQVNYANQEGDFHFINAALHPTDKEAELEYVANISGLPLWSCAIGSMVPEIRDKHTRMIKEECGRTPEFVKIKVPCMTFDDIFDKYNVQEVGELHIDTEGMDKEILVSFPFERFLPDKIIFEFVHLKPEDQKEATSLLMGLGYRLHQNDIDYVAVKN